MIEIIKDNNIILAIIVRKNFEKEGIVFFTDDSFSQQLGYMKRPKDYVISPHFHKEVNRQISRTQEVLFIKSGLVRVDFFLENSLEYFTSKILNQGDVVLLANGGHGFKMIEESEIIEVKQGPFESSIDKVRFNSVDENKVKY
jgi:hypothetical protein